MLAEYAPDLILQKPFDTALQGCRVATVWISLRRSERKAPSTVGPTFHDHRAVRDHMLQLRYAKPSANFIMDSLISGGSSATTRHK